MRGLVGGLIAALAIAAFAAAPAGAKTVTYKWGPVKLAAFTVKRDTAFPRTPKVNGYITAMSARVVDRKGRPIPISRVMLHHLLFSNDGRFEGDRRDGSCPDIPRERFFGKGEEGLHLKLPAGYGYRIRKRDRWRMNWMLMNHTTRREAAFIQYRMTIVQHRKLTPVKPFWLDVARCHGGSIFTNPGNDIGGPTFRQAVGWRVPFDGKIVDGGTHLHGGALDMKIRQPACHDRVLMRSRALYGMPDDPVYRVRPILHEPGPIATEIVQSDTGIRIRKGDRLRATTLYENADPHAAAMAMWHIYVAHAKRPAKRCGELPADLRTVKPNKPTRLKPPHFPVPLTTYDGKRWRTIEKPPGKTRRLGRRPTVRVRTFGYKPANLSVPRGATIRWRFPDPLLHNVTIATGPKGFASLHLADGGSFKQRLTRPGKYKLYCSLHPTLMQEVVTVRPR